MHQQKKEPEVTQRSVSFLRWIGGKRLLIPRLIPLLPNTLHQGRYHEPFAGAANLFFSLTPQRARISDLNEHLIECYKQVRDNYRKVNTYLREHQRLDSEEHYYQVRSVYNDGDFGPAQAARFIYMNHTCFNGVFRVNQKGAFNVPYPTTTSPRTPTCPGLPGNQGFLET